MTMHNVPWNQLSDYDAFGVLGPEYYGLDYESARDATPRWYGVSFGNGNDGVSHMWPNYYVRTADPFQLAAAAIVANWNDDDMRAYAAENAEIDGEADYTISAMILNPPDDDDDSFYIDAAGNQIEEHIDSGMWRFVGDDSEEYESEAECARAYCDSEGIESESWCNVNGAWIVCEVFAMEPETQAPKFDSLESCFTESDLTMAATI